MNRAGLVLRVKKWIDLYIYTVAVLLRFVLHPFPVVFRSASEGALSLSFLPFTGKVDGNLEVRIPNDPRNLGVRKLGFMG